MKESKKNILKVLSKDGKKKAGKFDRMVLLLALQKIDGDQFEYDDEAIYTADKRCLVYCLSQKDNVTVPEGVEVIGEMAFRRKKHLKNIILPTGLKKISRDAFFDCDQLDHVYVPATVSEVGGYAFAECESLKSVTFASKPKHLSRHAFEDSDNLSRIVVPAGTLEAFQKALHYDAVEDEYLLMEAQSKASGREADKRVADPKGEGDSMVKQQGNTTDKPQDNTSVKPQGKSKAEGKSKRNTQDKQKDNGQDKH